MPLPGEDLQTSLIVPPSSRKSRPPQPPSSMTNKRLPMTTSETLASLRSNVPAKADMHVHHPAPPAGRFQEPVKGNTTKATSGDLPVYGVEEYLSKYKAENKDLIAAREATRSPAMKKLKTNENAVPAPVAVGAKSSKNTVLLHDAHQALSLPQPHFTFEGSGDSGWTAEVSFIGLDIEELQNVKEPGHFSSKQEAKEATSTRALGILERLKEEGRVKTPVKGKKKKAQSATEPAAEIPKADQTPVENYIGQLLEFQRAISGPAPTYTDYQAGTRFACLLEIEGQPGPFGSLTSLHGSKKAARHDAARCAVEHFKTAGLWPDTFTEVGGIRKKKATQQQQQQSAVPVPDSSSKTPTSSDPTTAGTGPPIPSKSPTPSTSYAAQVAALAATLSLPTPEYIFTPCPDAPDFHTVVCVFRHGEPHAGPHGEVRNIFGRKKAKEECARLTLAVLEEVRKERAAFAEQMMAGLGVAGQGV